MRSLSKEDTLNKKLMVRLYRYHWNMMELDPTLSKKEACTKTLTENGFDQSCYVNSHCFLCSYMVTRGSRDFECELCPIEWPEFEDLAYAEMEGSAPCEKSHYGRWINSRAMLRAIPPPKRAPFWAGIGRIAGVISRLPEKEGL